MTSICVRGSTSVVPVRENGAGWLAMGVSVTRMVRLPCAMATVEMRTSAPITITPDCSSITTRAGWSGSTRTCLEIGEQADDALRVSVGLIHAHGGWVGRFRDAAADIGMTALAMRDAVVRSGIVQRQAQRALTGEIEAGFLFHDRALAMRPAVGTPWVTDAPAPAAENPPIATGPCASA